MATQIVRPLITAVSSTHSVGMDHSIGDGGCLYKVVWIAAIPSSHDDWVSLFISPVNNPFPFGGESSAWSESYRRPTCMTISTWGFFRVVEDSGLCYLGISIIYKIQVHLILFLHPHSMQSQPLFSICRENTLFSSVAATCYVRVALLILLLQPSKVTIL